MDRPKPMLPLHGKPLLQHSIEWLRGHDVDQIAVNLHHHAESSVDYFGDGSQFGGSLEYSYEQELLGTAGAAKRLQPYLDESFVVVYGDVYTNLDLTRLKTAHTQHQRAAASSRDDVSACLTMMLYTVPNPEACGIVETDAQRRVLRFVEKPSRGHTFTNLAFSGVMICEPDLLDHVPADMPFDVGHDLIPRLLDMGTPLYGEPLAAGEFVIDIGTLDGYLRALMEAEHRLTLTESRQSAKTAQML
jgi:NDP-sugar pyrophosphorylase family protein